MSIAVLLFWATAAVTLAGAGGAVFARNLVHAGFSLGACLLGVASLYLFLQAEFLAAVQLVVYVGGILILVLFGAMLSRDVQGAVQRPRWWQWALGVPAAALALTAMLRLASATAASAAAGGIASKAVRSDPAKLAENLSGPGANLGDLLLGPYLLPFLAIALLLTVALIGVVVLVRGNQPGAKEDA